MDTEKNSVALNRYYELHIAAIKKAPRDMIKLQRMMEDRNNAKEKVKTAPEIQALWRLSLIMLAKEG